MQLYLHQDYTSVERPVKELQGFARITLQPGESKTVTFPVGFEQVRFWKDHRFVAEPGTVDVLIGASSVDIRQRANLTLAAGPGQP